MKPIRVFRDERGWWAVTVTTPDTFVSAGFCTFHDAMMYVNGLLIR